MRNATLTLNILLAAALAATSCVATAIPGPPPAPRVEVRGLAPSPLHVFVDGHWDWRGGWVWVSGSWVARPHARSTWVPGHWTRHGRAWRWVPGVWR